MIHMSLDVSHIIPQSQVIDMTGGRFGNMAFGVSVTQDIWSSTRFPRAIATRFHQFTLKTSLPARDVVLKNFASKTPVNTLICKQTLIGEEFLKNYTRDQKSKVTGGKADPIQFSQGRKTPRLDLTSTHALSLCNNSSTLQKKTQNCPKLFFKKCAC